MEATSQKVKMEVPGKYFLEKEFFYVVDEHNLSAKFDKKKGLLTLQLKIISHPKLSIKGLEARKGEAEASFDPEQIKEETQEPKEQEVSETPANYGDEGPSQAVENNEVLKQNRENKKKEFLSFVQQETQKKEEEALRKKEEMGEPREIRLVAKNEESPKSELKGTPLIVELGEGKVEETENKTKGADDSGGDNEPKEIVHSHLEFTMRETDSHLFFMFNVPNYDKEDLDSAWNESRVLLAIRDSQESIRTFQMEIKAKEQLELEAIDTVTNFISMRLKKKTKSLAKAYEIQQSNPASIEKQ